MAVVVKFEYRRLCVKDNLTVEDNYFFLSTESQRGR